MNNDQYIDYINYIKSYHKSLNNAIMEAFMNNNISYIQAAALLGVNSSMMTKYTTAESKFTLEHVLQCSLFFRIPPSEFLRGCENMDCFAFSWDKFIGIRDEHIAYIKKMYTGKPQSIPSIMHFMDKQGLNWGIIILTAAILIPIANGSITYKEIVGCFTSRLGIISLLVGIFVALAGGAGVVALKATPEMVASLIIGTMLGVFIFKGVAVGPLIAAGMTYWVLSLLKHFNI